MKRYLSGLSIELSQLTRSLNDGSPDELNIFAREIARIELRLQAARSLIEARMFEAEIDNKREEMKAGISIKVTEVK